MCNISPSGLRTRALSLAALIRDGPIRGPDSLPGDTQLWEESWQVNTLLRGAAETTSGIRMTGDAGDAERRRISVSILGTRLSFKLPKVRVFKKKTEEWRREPEWSWQAVHTPTHRITQPQSHPQPHNSHPHSHPHPHSSLKDPRHRFLSRDQVDTIHQWLDQVPGPGEEEEDTSHHQCRPHHKQSIQTEIF